MKTFAFLAATVLAQKNKNNYNNNNNNYNNNSNYGSAYGDPHFMVSSNDQPAICFDYNPEANTRIELLRDPDTSLEVTAATKSTGNKHHEDQVIMSEITLSTPGGAKITMDRDGLHLDSSAEAGKRDSFTGVFDFADAKIVEHKAPNGSMDRAHIQVGDAVFIIKATKKGSMSFAIREPRGLSPRSSGLIGEFLEPNAYTVKVIDENNAEIILNGGKLDATKKDFHRTADCWVVDDDLAQFNDLINE